MNTKENIDVPPRKALWNKDIQHLHSAEICHGSLGGCELQEERVQLCNLSSAAQTSQFSCRVTRWTSCGRRLLTSPLPDQCINSYINELYLEDIERPLHLLEHWHPLLRHNARISYRVSGTSTVFCTAWMDGTCGAMALTHP